MQAYQFFEGNLLPGTYGFLMLGLATCVGLLWRTKAARAVLIPLTVLTVAYWALSTSFGAWSVSRLLAGGYRPVADSTALRGVQAIVVLDGGTIRYAGAGVDMPLATPASAARAQEAVHLYRLMRNPTVVVTGGSYDPPGSIPEGAGIRELLLGAGIPADRVVLDVSSRNTREHALNVPSLLRRMGITSFAVVTSAVHVRRAMRDFRKAGTEPLAAPAPLEPMARYRLWPTTGGLNRSMEAIHEILGLLVDSFR